MIALKLGGSVITEKDREETIDDAALTSAAAAVAGYDGDIVVVHGGGSFGHPAAQRYGISPEAGTSDAAAVRDVHDAMRRLNDAVVDRLADYGANPISVHPLSCAARTAAGRLSVATTSVETMIGEGFLPVLHGDVVAHAGLGATVVSGDELLTHLASGLGVDRVGLCTTERGVLDEAGTVVETIGAETDIATSLGGSDAPDVTGGMAQKVRTLQTLDHPANIFGLEDLEAFLDGAAVGTTVA